jgi:hypothetical protein
MQNVAMFAMVPPKYPRSTLVFGQIGCVWACVWQSAAKIFPKYPQSTMDAHVCSAKPLILVVCLAKVPPKYFQSTPKVTPKCISNHRDCGVFGSGLYVFRTPNDQMWSGLARVPPKYPQSTPKVRLCLAKSAVFGRAFGKLPPKYAQSTPKVLPKYFRVRSIRAFWTHADQCVPKVPPKYPKSISVFGRIVPFGEAFAIMTPKCSQSPL